MLLRAPPAQPRVCCAVKDPFRSLDELQRDLGQIAVGLTRTQFVHFSMPRGWSPAINAFRCGDHLRVCVELAGVDRSDIQITAEPHRLIIRGCRAAPEPLSSEQPIAHVLALEIDHGPFERVLELPAPIDSEHVTAEASNGLLWIKLPLRANA